MYYNLCEDCTQAAVNDDYSAVDLSVDFDEERFEIRKNQIVEGLNRLGDIYITEKENEFLSSDCDCCGGLPGKRFTFETLNDENDDDDEEDGGPEPLDFSELGVAL